MLPLMQRRNLLASCLVEVWASCVARAETSLHDGRVEAFQLDSLNTLAPAEGAVEF